MHALSRNKDTYGNKKNKGQKLRRVTKYVLRTPISVVIRADSDVSKFTKVYKPRSIFTYTLKDLNSKKGWVIAHKLLMTFKDCE